MKKFIKFKFMLVILIVLLGFFLRQNDYLTWPRHGATFDEFAWSWLGVNLIQKKVPISWSRHIYYNNKEYLKYQGAQFYIVKPYLEHPPLFGIVVGSFALANGVKDMYHVTLDKIRPLALVLGVLSILMVFLLTQELYGTKIGFIASILYATIPTVVVGSRIVQNENFLIPFWLLSLYFLSLYLRTGKKMLRNLSIIIAVLLPLAKVPWAVAPFSLVMILAYKQKWKDVFCVAVLSLLVFSLFMIYGIYYDKELFFNLFRFQMARYDISFNGFFSIFTSPLLVDRYYLDGWIYFGFISIFLLFNNLKNHIFILFSFLAYFLIFVFAIPNEPSHGWYRYPFYPFLIIAISVFIRDYLTKNQILTFLFLTFVGLSLFQLTWLISFGFSFFVFRLVIICFGLTLLSIFFKSKKLETGIKILNFLWLFFFILLNIWSVMLYNEQ